MGWPDRSRRSSSGPGKHMGGRSGPRPASDQAGSAPTGLRQAGHIGYGQDVESRRAPPRLGRDSGRDSVGALAPASRARPSTDLRTRPAGPYGRAGHTRGASAPSLKPRPPTSPPRRALSPSASPYGPPSSLAHSPLSARSTGSQPPTGSRRWGVRGSGMAHPLGGASSTARAYWFHWFPA